MQRIVDYFVVQGSSQPELIQAVQELIQKGWQPLGGVVIGKLFSDNRGHYASHAAEFDTYCQAIVKYQDVPERQDPSPTPFSEIVFREGTGTPSHLLKNVVTTPLNNDHRVMCGD